MISLIEKPHCKQINDQIIDNLYQFWRHIGQLTNRLTETENYTSVSMDNSDWPNRIFDFKNDNQILEKIYKPSQEEQPEIVTITKPNGLNSNSEFEFLFGQKNMALDLNSFSNNKSTNLNIERVMTKKDSIEFAKTASKSFGYRVDPNVVFRIVSNSTVARLFIYQENKECLACGIVFFDSYNNAGIHMIGTLHKGRGRGIGKRMTETLLKYAKENNMNNCVLHASLMGESIYKKIGFKTYGEIETYKILKKKNS